MKRSPLKRGTSQLKRTPMVRKPTTTLEVWCPSCGAEPGDNCYSEPNSLHPRRAIPHKERVRRGNGGMGWPRSRKPNGHKKQVPTGVRSEVASRSSGLCEAVLLEHSCTGTGEHVHHRLLRSLGGQHTPENLLHVCPTAHSMIHDHPEDSYRLGYLLHSWEAR